MLISPREKSDHGHGNNDPRENIPLPRDGVDRPGYFLREILIHQLIRISKMRKIGDVIQIKNGRDKNRGRLLKDINVWVGKRYMTAGKMISEAPPNRKKSRTGETTLVVLFERISAARLLVRK